MLCCVYIALVFGVCMAPVHAMEQWMHPAGLWCVVQGLEDWLLLQGLGESLARVASL